MDRAAPPRASPSSLVSTIPVSSTSSRNDCATLTASCPVIASHTSKISTGSTALATLPSSVISSGSTCMRPAVSTMRSVAPRSFAAVRARAATPGASSGDALGSACTGTPVCCASSCNWRMAAGRRRSQAVRSGSRPCFLSSRASLAAAVVLPEPCRPASKMTRGGAGDGCKPTVSCPRTSIRAACTSLMTCWAGVRLLWISAPSARSFTSRTKALTTLRATSASSSARRISRRTSSICFSDKRPLDRRRVKMSSRRPESESNIG